MPHGLAPRTHRVRTSSRILAALAAVAASAPLHAACTGDINGDDLVDAFDIAAVLGGWGLAGASDVNGDGVTGPQDLAIVLGNWGCDQVPLVEFRATPTAVEVGVQVTIQFAAQVPPSLIPGLQSLRVFAIDDFGLPTGGALATLVDTGAAAAGDDIAGDGVFSARVPFASAVPLQARLGAIITLPYGDRVSNIVPFTVFEPLTEAQVATILSGEAASQSAWDAHLATLGDTPEARAATVADILAQPGVVDAGIAADGLSIYTIYESGVEGGLMLNAPGTKGSGKPRVRPTSHGVPPALLRLPERFGGIGAPSTAVGFASSPRIGNGKVLVWAPYHSEFAAEDQVYVDVLGSSVCPPLELTVLHDAAASVDAAKHFNEYGTIVISTHGATDQDGQMNLLTGTEATQFAMFEHSALLHVQPRQLVVKSGRLALKPGFFATFAAPAYPDSLVYISACTDASRIEQVADVLLSTGAQTVIPFDNTVSSDFASGVGGDLLSDMLAGSMSVGQAFAKVQSRVGPHGEHPKLFGAQDLAYTSQLQNSGFDEGLQGWSTVGDARTIGILGNFPPTEGTGMGIISTGLGFTTESGSVSQTVCLPASATELVFDWNYLSEEFIEYCGPQFPFDDPFVVEVDWTGGNHQVLFIETVDSLCGEVFPVSVDFDDGDVHATGWRTTALPIAAIALEANGSPVTFTFHCFDKGDSVYDTAVLLDRISIH